MSIISEKVGHIYLCNIFFLYFVFIDRPTHKPTRKPTRMPTYSPQCPFPIDVVLLWDLTCGLQKDQCYRQREAIVEFIENLQNDGTRIALVSYTDGCTMEFGFENPMYEGNVTAMGELVRSIDCTQAGNTDIGADCGLDLAIDLLQAVTPRIPAASESIVWFTNCETQIGDEQCIEYSERLTDELIEVVLVPSGESNAGDIDDCLANTHLPCPPNADYNSAEYTDCVEGVITEVCEVPTPAPTIFPTDLPTSNPTKQPTGDPTAQPTNQPTAQPTNQPTSDPTQQPTTDPTKVCKCYLFIHSIFFLYIVHI